MKAVVTTKYGTPDILELRDVKRPEPKPNEVLVKVLAASVNKADWQILNGKPFAVKMMAGLFRPKYRILGADVAGVVESVGREVTQFKKGDEVYGDLSGSGFGGFAEYVTTVEPKLARKPANLTFEEAASLPLASVTALQGLRDKGEIEAGQQVLINGASGGVGLYAVQIAKAFGAEVTGVCSEQKMERAYRSGADRVIDYADQDFTQEGKRYDLIFDTVANHSPKAISRVLKPKGRYVTCAVTMKVALFGAWHSIKSRQKMTNLIAGSTQADLQFIASLAEEGKIRPNVEKTYTLDDVPEALWDIGKGHASGKLVITV